MEVNSARRSKQIWKKNNENILLMKQFAFQLPYSSCKQNSIYTLLVILFIRNSFNQWKNNSTHTVIKHCGFLCQFRETEGSFSTKICLSVRRTKRNAILREKHYPAPEYSKFTNPPLPHAPLNSQYAHYMNTSYSLSTCSTVSSTVDHAQLSYMYY